MLPRKPLSPVSLARALWAVGFTVMFCTTATAEIKGKRNDVQAVFDNVSLEAALSEIADTFGVDIYTSQALEQNISANYQNISLDDLLKKLLYGYNAMYLNHPKTGQLITVRIFSTGKTPPPITKGITFDETEAIEEDGKYYLTIGINGKPVRMLVDTGATTLTLSLKMSRQLALPLLEAKPVQTKTAGGQARGALTTLDSVEMAGKEIKDVQVIILPALEENGLIGQNVLKYFRRVSEGGKMQFQPIDANNNQQQAAGQNTDQPTNPNSGGGNGNNVNNGVNSQPNDGQPPQGALRPNNQPIQ